MKDLCGSTLRQWLLPLATCTKTQDKDDVWGGIAVKQSCMNHFHHSLNISLVLANFIAIIVLRGIEDFVSKASSTTNRFYVSQLLPFVLHLDTM